MSSRITRSAARQAAQAANQTIPPSDPSATQDRPVRSKKRKSIQRGASAEASESVPSPSVPTKRRKIVSPADTSLLQTPSSPATVPSVRRGKARAPSAMSNSGKAGGSSKDKAVPDVNNVPGPSRRRSGRRQMGKNESSASDVLSTSQQSKKKVLASDSDAVMDEGEEKLDGELNDVEDENHDGSVTEDDGDDGTSGSYSRDDEEDPFSSGFLGGAGGPPPGLSSTLRALSGMVSGVSSRLRELLHDLKQREDPSIQLIALGELSQLLLVSNEDNLSGHFAPDQFVKELVRLMQPNDFGEDNQEMMLIACRCIYNMMEALPAATANVVYGGAVPVLCQKLLEIQYIDLAEQAISTLEKISNEFPSAIVREGGLTACLTYLDFFATGTQRSAVTTAANCCRNIPEDSFPVVRDVMPTVLSVLGGNDQKVVEQGCLCVSRVVESFRHSQEKIEALVSIDLLKAITRLLLPGTTTLIGPSIHTKFLRVLSIVARASPKLSAALFKENIVDTLYQILTGVSPPDGIDDVASKIDSVVIMQALIHRPREQVSETLNVICELLPGLPMDKNRLLLETFDANFADTEPLLSSSMYQRNKINVSRVELLQDCQDKLKRFAVILLPTLTDAYSSTVNLAVRQRVLIAQLKMLSNLDTSILAGALRDVPYASHLASILSQQDHPSLVIVALLAAELLLERLEGIYRYQFYREGVVAEIIKLAASPKDETKVMDVVGDVAARVEKMSHEPQSGHTGVSQDNQAVVGSVNTHEETSDEDDEDDGIDDMHDDLTASPISSPESTASGHHLAVTSKTRNVQQKIALQAKRFLDTHEQETAGESHRETASKILQDLRRLATKLRDHYLHHREGNGLSLFTELADYFERDAMQSITSHELLSSDIVQMLLDLLANSNVRSRDDARATFLEVFMGRPLEAQRQNTGPDQSTTPFSALVHKLQDLLSRAEHFEVVTVQPSGNDGSRSSPASMLARQIRLKLELIDDDVKIPPSYRNFMVSIHAIATFKALDDYLRPKIILSDRPRAFKHRDGGVSSALAAFAAAAGLPSTHQRFTDRGVPSLASPGSTPSSRKSGKSNGQTSTPTNQTSQEKASSSRRSTRRRVPHDQPPVPPLEAEPAQSEPTLECADESQVTDDTGPIEEGEPLDAIVDDLEEGMDDDVQPDPSAVNLEVALTGKVTARKEDGTRVATPTQVPGASSRTLLSSKGVGSKLSASLPAPTTRHSSYAAAMQAIPQDWHLEFSIGNATVPNETTIYRAVHNNQIQSADTGARGVWQAIHTVQYKRVPGPPPPEPSTLTLTPDSATEVSSSGMPVSLDKNPATSAILQLLNILHALNANLDDVLVDNKESLRLFVEPLAQFVNTKLTAKLNRQLEEPLIVASNCLPNWSDDLARLYPFLFPFETRHLFLQSTSFGYSRSMSRWQNAQSTSDSRSSRRRDDRPFLGRLQRQKVRISRSRILESAVKVMELYGSSPSILEVEYFEEVGTGLGPTLEFYSTVSKEFSKKKLKLWRENESSDADIFAFGRRGLFPAPMSAEELTTDNGKKVLHLFRMLGKFVARSMLDSRIIDVSFNPTFFRIGDGRVTVSPSLGAVKAVDEGLAKSLSLLKHFATWKKKIDEDVHLNASQKANMAKEIRIDGVRVEDLGLDFTLPGYPSIELQPNGSNIPVNIDNVGLYVERVIDLTLGGGVRSQVDAFRAGFTMVFPYTALKAFTPDELVMLFGRIEEDWSLETLMDSIKADHGFNMDSKSVKNLLQTMSALSANDRREFLQFVTGSPKLPIGGFKSLTPMFTVVCKPSEPPYSSDDYLPSVMTCVNYLKLPDYSDLDTMRKRLSLAIREGQGAFHLS
ncbi:MAG: hypothetical protein M1825_000012 [Sarcosagium campestre]|nr:MAG: hypothetical protein M1825_000012 [Sarcosagium campestre]